MASHGKNLKLIWSKNCHIFELSTHIVCTFWKLQRHLFPQRFDQTRIEASCNILIIKNIFLTLIIIYGKRKIYFFHGTLFAILTNTERNLFLLLLLGQESVGRGSIGLIPPTTPFPIFFAFIPPPALQAISSFFYRLSQSPLHSTLL